MFGRLDQRDAHREWFSRNGYPARAFGVGSGFNRDHGYRYGGGRRSHRYGSAAYHDDSPYRIGHGVHHVGGYGYDRHQGYGGHNGHRSNYRHYYSPFRSYTSFGLGFGFGRRTALRYSHYYGYHRYPYYGFNSIYDYAPLTSIYSSYGYPTYSAPASPVYVDVNNYGYSPNGGSTAIVPLDSSSASPSLQSFSHRDLAEAAFYRGEYDLARRELIRAMLATPDDAELLLFYAYAHFATGDYITAAQSMRRALEADPSLADQPLDIAAYYGQQIDFENQFEHLERTIAANPYDSEFLFVAGYVQYAAGHPGLANEIFQRAASRAPNDLLTMIMRDASFRARNLQESSALRGGVEADVEVGPDTLVIPQSQSREFIPEVRPTYPVENE